MANEIAVTVRASLANESLKDEVRPGQVKFDQTVAVRHANTLSITSLTTQVTFPTTVEGWCFMTNLSSATTTDTGGDDILVGPTTVNMMVRVPRGGTVAFQVAPGTTMHAKMAAASTPSAISLDYTIWST